MAESERRFKIGYALAAKKQKSFIQPSLTNLATQKGMDLIKIDLEKPLVDQGPFDCVLHKCYGQDWKKQLELFLFRNPNVVILDSPDAIERLHNRISMLQAVSELEMECQNVIKTASFGIPEQVLVYDNQAILNQKDWGEGLNFPVIAKPLVADGTAKSHKMRLIYNHEGLKKLKPPIVLQQFVNHGGVIFKVFVVGEYVRCVKRMSLPDVSKEKLESLEGEGEGSLSFSQVSNLTNLEKIGEKYCKMMDLEGAEMPPMCLITEIAHGLRRAIKLNLFNFDVIRDTRVGNRYLVIDINYFPGYAKMPSYETVLTDFFWDVLNNKEVGFDSRVVGNNGCGELPRKSLLDRS